MHSDEDDFYGTQPGTSGLTLSHTNNKSSVLCPETQDITSQYLVLQQLDAHQKMISRAKGCVDTSAPKSMQSYRSVASRRKHLKHLKSDSQISIHTNQPEEYKKPSSSRLTMYNSEEDENESINTSFVNKAIQTGIPVSNITSKTAEKISWYLEALTLGELQSEYFAFLDSNFNTSREFRIRNFPGSQKQKRIIRGDIMDWHQDNFVMPRKPFSPRILDSTAKSKIKDMRCYNPPFRKKKTSSSHSSDTFESYDDDEEEEMSQRNGNKTSDNSSVEEEIQISKRLSKNDASLYNTPVLPHYRKEYSNYSDPSILSQSEEDKYLDFLTKVTEDILRSGVYSDKAIQQAFEFHMQFYKDDPNKERLQSLLEQLLEGLKITSDEEHFHQRNSFLFPHSRLSSPPEKETSATLFSSDSCKTTDLNSSAVNESVDNVNELNDS